MNGLIGAAVRHWDGRKGRILSIEEDVVTIEWNLAGSAFITYEQVIPAASLASEDRMEVLDLHEGWTPLARFFTAPPPQWGEVEEASGSKFSPFKTRTSSSGGPFKTKKKKRGQYKCHCKDYKCDCAGPKGAHKKVKIKRKYKKWYNRIYMDFLQGRSGTGSKRKGKA